jgi:hypothetical protein
VPKSPLREPQTAPPSRAPNRWRRILLSSFLLFHIVAILASALPLNSLLVVKAKELVAPYMLWSGLFQGWNMFAPDPQMLNAFLEAEITFRDGTNALWKFPRMEQLGLTERYFRERYRKWAHDTLRLDANLLLWPDAARYIARLHFNPANPPVSVRLIRHWAEIPPPPNPGQPPTAARWKQFVFYTHPVQPGDLR